MLFQIGVRVGTVGAIALLVIGTAGCKKDEARQDPTTTSSTAAAVTGGSGNSVRLTPSQGELTTLLPAEVAKARAKNLKPFVELRADWCGPCKELEASMKDPRMVDAFAGTYVITLDADDWKQGQLKPMGLDASAIPVFFELDDNGKSTGRRIDGGAWAENIPVNMAPPLKAFFSAKK